MQNLRFWVISLIALSLLSTSTYAAPLDRIGVMGDSLSSEYAGGLGTQFVFGRSYRPYKSWVEQLVSTRSLNFGAYGYWGFYPGEGYQFNRASVYNIDTQRLLSTNQATEVRSLNPTLAVLEIGANDFFFHAQAHATPSYLFGGLFDGQDPTSIVAGMLTRYRTALETVAGPASSPTGTLMVLATVPDITRTPIVSSLGSLLYPGSIDRYRAATDLFNDGIRSLASERGFAVMDLNASLNTILGPISSPRSSFQIGGVTFNTQFNSNTTSTDAFLHDGFHPNGILHSLLANEFLRSVNRQYGLNVSTLDTREILAQSGLTPIPETRSLMLISAVVFVSGLFSITRGSKESSRK